MVLLFVVCGWRKEAVAGVCRRTYSVHSACFFFCTRATISLFRAKPTVLTTFGEAVNTTDAEQGREEIRRTSSSPNAKTTLSGRPTSTLASTTASLLAALSSAVLIDLLLLLSELSSSSSYPSARLLQAARSGVQSSCFTGIDDCVVWWLKGPHNIWVLLLHYKY
jgi:hypothetical protein